MGGSKPKAKSFEIPKRLIVQAWEKVQANGGAPGMDVVSITVFDRERRDNLYKLWNRMSSGSYMPKAVRAVEIPKDHGVGIRVLGVPTVADRVAQTAVCMLLEEKLEPIFHPDSYGYRPDGGSLPRCNSETGRSSHETKGPRKGRRSHRFWPTCSCTMRSTGGWPWSIQAVHSSVTQMTWLSTATARNRPASCWPA